MTEEAGDAVAQNDVGDVFIGPVEISGIAAGLLAGLTVQGIKAHTGFASPHPFKYDTAGVSNRLLTLWQAVGDVRVRTPRSQLPKKLAARTAHQCLAWVVLITELHRSWAFVFLFGETITNSRAELWLLRLFRKRIVFIYVGSDARPLWMDCLATVKTGRRNLTKLARAQREQAARIARQQKVAAAVVSARTTAQLIPQPFVDALALGLPLLATQTPIDQPRPGTVRVLHSPSSRAAKGTLYVERAVDELWAQGVKPELVCVSGQPHDVVMSELAKCDFVIDQVFSDLPWSAFVAEAASLGKPAVIAGYAAEWYPTHVPEDKLPPSLYVLPRDLKDAVRTLALSPERRADLGKRAQEFAAGWSAERVANRLLTLLRGETPADWLVDPAPLDYVLGCGCPAIAVQKQARALVATLGEQSLGLSHAGPTEAVRAILNSDVEALGP